MSKKCMETKYRRQELLAEPGVPTQSEVRRNLGSPLAEIFFSSLDDTCKQLLGLAPPIVPPEQVELWMSPSDTLIGKVMLTPPMPTRRVVRALTHEGIIEIGGECLYKLENEARLDKERALEELEANLRHLAAMELERAVQQARAEEREIHEREVEALLESFRKALEQAVADTELRLHKQMAARVQKERSEVHELMQDQMQAAVFETEMIMSAIFQQKLLQTIEDLNNHYHEYIHLMADHFHWRLRLEAYTNAQYVLQLRFHLEAQNEIDISYAVCRERQRCHAEKELIIQEFTEQIAELHKVIESMIAQLEEERQRTARALVKCQEWEDRVREIVREFQKFINFALKAIPGQAQFLLSLERLLILEMQRPVEPEPEPEPEPESLAEITETAIEEQGEEEEEPELEAEIGEPQPLEPEMQMAVTAEDLQSEGEQIAIQLLGELINQTASMADTIVTQTLSRIIMKAVPPNTEQEEVIGYILEKLIERAVPLAEDVVKPIIELLLKASTPIPEGEIVIAPILDDMVETAMGPEMFDAATQAPPIEEHRVTMCDEILLWEDVDDTGELNEMDEIAGEQNEMDENAPGTEVKPILRPSKDGEQCAWCGIKAAESLVLLKPPPDVEPSVERTNSAELPTSEELSDQETVQACGIVGEGGSEHQQPAEEFVADRVQSLLKIFREHPSVAQIFVPPCGI